MTDSLFDKTNEKTRGLQLSQSVSVQPDALNEQAVAAAGTFNAAAAFAMIERMTQTPGTDVDAMRAVTDLALRLADRQMQQEFNQDKLRALSLMPVITKRGAIMNRDGKVQSNFARFEDIMAAVKPILENQRLALSFDIDSEGVMVKVTPILSHANGFVERGGSILLPIDSSGSKNGTQGVGSSVTYGKRFTCCAMLNIVTAGIDDDGQGGKDQRSNFNEEAQLMIVKGETAAMGGVQIYREWFSSIGLETRRWMAASGDHTRLKQIAEGAGN